MILVPGIVTFSCERSRTSQSSRAREKDGKSSSSRSISCQLEADQRLQFIQHTFEGDDPRIGCCGVIQVVRNCTKSIMFPLFCKESRNCVLHCGQRLIDSESRRKFNKLRFDALSIPNYVARPKYKKSTMWFGMRGRDAQESRVSR